MSTEALERLKQLINDWIETGDLEEARVPVKLLLEDVCSALDVDPASVGLS